MLKEFTFIGKIGKKQYDNDIINDKIGYFVKFMKIMPSAKKKLFQLKSLK